MTTDFVLKEDVETFNSSGISLIGSHAFRYANIVISNGCLVKYDEIAHKDYPEFNALYIPKPRELGKKCQPVMIGDIPKWIADYNPGDISWFQISSGYKLKIKYHCVMYFDHEGYLHADDGPAYHDYHDYCGAYGEKIYSRHGYYTNNKINIFYRGSCYIATGKVQSPTSSGINLKIINIKNLTDYTGPAYVFIETKNGIYVIMNETNTQPYSQYPQV